MDQSLTGNKMIFTGFTDEASSSISDQIKITKELGWDYLSLRTTGSANIHDVPEVEFESVLEEIESSDLRVAELGTLIGNWSKPIHSDWQITIGEIDRCINRMHRLHVKYARIMSYAQEPWGQDQHVIKRISRLKEIVRIFHQNGLTAVHENCMNYGGFSAQHTLALLNEIPDLKLVFDTGNPVFQRDRSKSAPYPWQDSLEFFHAVKSAIVHIHIKDAIINENDEVEYCFAGEGNGHVREIITELHQDSYEGFLAIEPHMGKVFHEIDQNSDSQAAYDIYLEYGKRFERLVHSIRESTISNHC